MFRMNRCQDLKFGNDCNLTSASYSYSFVGFQTLIQVWVLLVFVIGTGVDRYGGMDINGPTIQGLLSAPDNTGKEFIVGFTEHRVKNGSAIQTELCIATASKTEVRFRVRIPKFDPSHDETYFLKQYEGKTVKLPPNTRMLGTSFGSRGILIEADDEITVFGINQGIHSTDGFLAFPTDVLDVEYYAVSWYPPTVQCQLMVVGISESTVVNVILSQALGSKTVKYDGKKYWKGDLINLTMNRYDTVQIQSKGDLTGTFINSTKPVAVFSGNSKSFVTENKGDSRDHMVEQMPPVNTWGKQFITITIPGRTVGDHWKFVASEDDTLVKITGKKFSEAFTISSAGDHEERKIPSGPDYYCHIEADKPILVVQFDTVDPSMLFIPPVEQYAHSYTFATPRKSVDLYENFLMFVVKDSEKDGLLIDGNCFPNDTPYHKIPGTDFVGGVIRVNDGTHTVLHTSPVVNFIGYLFGKVRLESYGFPIGTRMAPINSVCSNSTTVEGDGIDNDCDGLIDEELCTKENLEADDDGDGLTDEDCAFPLPINGNWGPWSTYSTCLASGCDSKKGSQTRTRICNCPAPRYDGELCRDIRGKSTLTEHDTVSCSSYTNNQGGSNLYFKQSSKVDTTISKSDVALKVNSGSLFSCAMVCMNNVNQCKSFYYSPDTGLCTGLKHKENADDKPVDAVHYRIENDG